MTERHYRFLTILFIAGAAMCWLKVLLRLANSSLPDLVPNLLSVSWDAVLALIFTYQARLAWGRGAKKITMSDLE